MLERLLLGAVALVAFLLALLTRKDQSSSTLSLVLVGFAGLLGIVAVLLPYLSGLSAGVGGVSLALSFAAAKPEGLEEQPSSLSGHLDPISGKATVTASGRTALSEVVKGGDVEYAVIDLGSGDRWLASRLLIFTAVMQQLRKIQCIVLTETGPDARSRLLGLVGAQELQRAIAWQYPWLDVALFNAWQNISTSDPPVAPSKSKVRVAKLSADNAEGLYNKYVEQLRDGVPGPDAANWTELQITDWEHSPMLTGDSLGSLLGGVLDRRSVRRSRDRSRQIADVLSTEEASYVALVDADHRFVSLVDRTALLEELASEHTQSPS